MNPLRLTLLVAGGRRGARSGNLGANWMIAEADPRIRALLVERLATLAPLVGLVASPILEEVAVRLFLMSGMAWVVSRVTARRGLTFGSR